MLRSKFVIACVVLGMFGCDSQPAPAGKAADKAPAAKVDTPPSQPPQAPPAQDEVEPPPPVEPPAEPTEVDTAAPTDTAAVEPPPTEPEPTAAGGSGNLAIGGWKAPDGVDIRSDAAIPPGTPPANAEAFKSLPVAKADGAPVSAIGASGIHFDSLVVGRGWEKSRCVEATNTFSPATDDRVNICLRVVHPADAEEVLTVEWSKVGSKSVRRSSVTVKAMHAFLTRSYFPIKAGYEGDWTASIKTEDGTTLATVNFKVE
jgi:hypothetical protein